MFATPSIVVLLGDAAENDTLVGVPALLWTLACDGSATAETKAAEAKAPTPAVAEAEPADAVKTAPAEAEKTSPPQSGTQDGVAAEAATKPESAAEAAKPETKAPATTPAAGIKFGKWKLASATWSDGGAAELTEAPARSIAACLRTVKNSRAEVAVTVAFGKIARADVKGESLKCVEELRGVALPGITRDGDFTAMYTQ